MSRKAKKSVLEETENPVGFTHLPTLPHELRQLIYSKMEFVERANGARASEDMAAYFIKHRMSTPNEISLTEKDGYVFMKIQFGKTYVEMHRIPDELVQSFQRELQSNHKVCSCYFCDESRRDDVYDEVSAPVGGLVDFVQPDSQLAERVGNLILMWHLHEGVRYVRNDPEFKKDNWGKWFDFARPYNVYIDKNLRRFHVEERTVFAYSEDGPVVHIHKDLYDLPAIHNAGCIEQVFANVDVSLQQLEKMRATQLLLDATRSQLLSNEDLLEFFKSKIRRAFTVERAQIWLNNPKMKYYYILDSTENIEQPPHCDHQKLLADVRDQLQSPYFLVYPGVNFNNYQGVDYSGDLRSNDISIRCVKTGTALFVNENRLISGSAYDPLPEHNGHQWT